MKIGFILPDFRGGGAERVFITLINYYFRNGIDVLLIVSTNNGPLKDYIDPGVEVIETGIYGVKSCLKIRDIVVKKDLTVLTGTLNMAYVVSLLTPFLPKTCKTVARIGNTITEDLKNHSGMKKLIQSLYQYVLILSDEIVVQSEYMKNDLISFIGFNKIEGKVHLIYNPIDFIKVDRLSLEKDLPHEFISGEDIVVVGRLERQKDHKTSILAFQEYTHIYGNSKLHILGEGSLHSEIKSFVNLLGLGDKVIFHGHISNPYPFIKNAKMLIMSSLYEGFSNVLLEAIYLKTPVVVSDCPGGNSEIVENGINGYLFETGNSIDMADKMKCIDEHDLLGSSADEFNVSVIASKYINLFN